MNITASMVKELREMTGAGMMDCKKALVECDGDIDKAVDFLKEKGLAKAAKKAGRVAAEGTRISIRSARVGEISVDKIEVKVTDEEVDAEINRERESNARTINKGDGTASADIDLSELNPVILLGNKGLQIQVMTGITKLLVGVLVGDMNDYIEYNAGATSYKYYAYDANTDYTILQNAYPLANPCRSCGFRPPRL